MKVCTIFGYEGVTVYKSMIAAKYNNVQLDFKPIAMGVDNKTPEFLAKFPLGKVPVFESGDGFCLNESNAIAFYGLLLSNNSRILL